MAGIEETIKKELNKDQLREALLKYTRKAFSAIPEIETPRILDIGCGTGIPTITLAKLSGGEVTGIDIDGAKIKKLKIRIEKEGLSNRVKAIECSLLEMTFPDENFDILWAEGVMDIIGFRKRLKRWRRLIKSHGYLVIHDDEERAEEKERVIPLCGYSLIQKFSLPSTVWRKHYFRPLKKRIEQLSARYKSNQKIMKQLQKKQEEIDYFNSNPRGSIFFIMQVAEWKGGNGGKNQDH